MIDVQTKINSKLRFGVAFLANAPMDILVRQYKHVERLNFDIAGTGDQFVNYIDPKKLWYEQWTLTTAWAVNTKHIKIGTFVTAFPYRNPAILVKQAVTLDHISGGRLELGLGAALESDPFYKMTGTPNWKPRERIARFREYVEIVGLLLRNEETNYEGKYYSIKGAIMNPLSIQKPRLPIAIAANQPRMIKNAVQYADTWITLGSPKMLDEIQRRNQLADKYCNELGRDPRSLRRSYWMYEHNALANEGFLTCYESEDYFRELALSIIEVGINEILVSYPCREEQLPVFEKIAQNVIPELKKEYTRLSYQ
jgi:alkanesulfonate monooxygenase SsuD/methylene tetrahydromethanopterin reductase-like flavin-dependent oxidoreductase (luciferase family)